MATEKTAKERALENIEETWSALQSVARDPEHPQHVEALALILAYGVGTPCEVPSMPTSEIVAPPWLMAIRAR